MLHEALTIGGALGPNVCAQGAKGLGPWSEDASIAYHLLLQVRPAGGSLLGLPMAYSLYTMHTGRGAYQCSSMV